MHKKINQINKNQSIVVSCYRFAPESINACIRVENPHNPNVPAYYRFEEKKESDILKAIKEQGYNFICGRYKETYDAIKRAIRKHNRTRQLYFTYGFKIVGDEARGVHLVDPYFFEKVSVSMPTKKALFTRIKETLSAKAWKYEKHSTASLGAGYQIEKVKSQYQAINPLKPYKIYSY